MKTRSSIDINTLFMAANWLFLIGTGMFYAFNEFPTLVDAVTLVIYVLLFLQMQVFLSFEKARRNAFLLILVFIIIFFYFPRIVTLYWYDVWSHSRVLERLHPASVVDINYTLFFIFIANWLIFLGVFVAQCVMPRMHPRTVEYLSHINAGRIQLLLLFALLYSLYMSFVNPLLPGNTQRLLSYLSIVFNPSLLVPFALIYLFQNSKMMSISHTSEIMKKPRDVLGIAILLLFLVVLLIIYGSRSAILTIVQSIFFVVLALGIYRVNRKLVVACALLIVLSVPIFAISTQSRAIRNMQGMDIRISTQLERLSEYVSDTFLDPNIMRMLIPVFDRTAFLDFSVDLVKNSAEYAEVISLPFYFKSTLDANTPGFDVFNTPKAANALNHVYAGEPLARIVNSYQSDQFNVYGEYYVLFGGWFSLPFFFISSFLFQLTFSSIRLRSLFGFAVWRYFVLVLFYGWLISFGLDWQITNAIQKFFLFYVFFLVINRNWRLHVYQPTRLRSHVPQ